jgi:pyruvate kinase
MKRTKTICTLGPSTDRAGVMSGLAEAGMDAAAFDFAAGSHAEHTARLRKLRELARELARPMAAVAELAGVRPRVAGIASGNVQLHAGQAFTLTTRDVPGNEWEAGTCQADLARDVARGDRILIASGRIELGVDDVRGPDVRCRVLVGGELVAGATIHLPDSQVSGPCLTDSDRVDLELVLDGEFDAIAIPGARSAADVLELKTLLRQRKRDLPVLVMLERPGAMPALDELIAVADGVVLVRGGLCAAAPLLSLPSLQRSIIRRCRAAGVPLITAAHRLESMVASARPGPAEVSDVAGAVLEGADALWLLSETADGQYPVEACRMTAQIALDAGETEPGRAAAVAGDALEDVVSRSACQVADDVGARAIVVHTQTGQAARRIARHRPRMPIYAFTPRPEIARRLCLEWGVVPAVVSPHPTFEGLIDDVNRLLVEHGWASVGETVVFAGGIPAGRPGATNTIRAHRVEPPARTAGAPAGRAGPARGSGGSGGASGGGGRRKAA